MTDKTKILAEIERLICAIPDYNDGIRARRTEREEYKILNNLLYFINSLPEEPVNSIWHDASEPPIIDKTFLLVAPNGNSSLCLWGGKELHSVTIGGGHSVLCKGDIYSYIDDLLNLDNSCNFGKNLQEEPVSKDYIERYKNITQSDAFKSAYENKSLGEVMSVEGEKPVSEDLKIELKKYIKGHFTIDTEQLDRFGIEEKDYMYSMDKSDMLALVEHFTNWQKTKEEPVSEDLEEVSKKYALNNTPYEDCTDEMSDAFKAGAKWQKQQDSIPSKDLAELIDTLSKRYPEVSFAKLSRIAVRVAKWKEKEMQSTIELVEDHAILTGMNKMEQQMMAKAIDAQCFGFQGAALFSFRLPADKYLVGSEVKVIVIKED